MTTLGQFKGLYEYLKQRKMVPDFLAHGRMVLVREVIVETDLLETKQFGHCDSFYDAIALSLKEDRHERVADLFEAAYERPDWKNKFVVFAHGFFERHPLEKDSMPLKRFLSLYGKEFSKKHPAIFEILCGRLVLKLRLRPDNLASQKLLIDLVGQPSLLTPVALARGFLCAAGGRDRANFIKYGYKEAVEEGLKRNMDDGGIYLWRVMVSTLPNQFSGEYPSNDEARIIALRDFKPTKQDLEEQWLVNNAMNPQAKLRMRQLAEYLGELDINIPIVLWVIVAEYATVSSWIDTE